MEKSYAPLLNSVHFPFIEEIAKPTKPVNGQKEAAMKQLYLIGGPMGVGKTTVCQLLKAKLPRSVFLDGDWCWDANPFQVTEETRAMVLDNICHLLNNFLRCSAYDHVLFCWSSTGRTSWTPFWTGWTWRAAGCSASPWCALRRPWRRGWRGISRPGAGLPTCWRGAPPISPCMPGCPPGSWTSPPSRRSRPRRPWPRSARPLRRLRKSFVNPRYFPPRFPPEVPGNGGLFAYFFCFSKIMQICY